MLRFLNQTKPMPVTIETARLLIRAAQPQDFEQLLPIYNRQENMQYILDGKSEWKREEIISKWQHLNSELTEGIGLRVVIEKASGQVIGEAGILSLERSAGEYLEIGFMLDKAWRGQGLATEVVQALLSHAFEEMNLSSLRASALEENQPSLRLLEKSGFRPVGKVQNGGGKTLLHYEIQAATWKAG